LEGLNLPAWTHIDALSWSAAAFAGPALALFLARAGIEPVVFEAYPPSEDVGGGFQIAPNGLRVLAELGLADTLLAQGHACSDMAFRNHHGRLIGVVRTARAGLAVNVMRATVHHVLRDEAERRGIDIRYRKRLTSVIEVGREVVATFDDGTTEVGDFLVGAVHSRVRACILRSSPSRATRR
jgi:2-polyprenyl-6-methoxyphenol hydroxylase-like FAD-dependent oxidoreductase